VLQFNVLGFPVSVHWFFWLVCFLLSGGLSMKSMDQWPQVIGGMAAIFFSILVHELGHALAARRYGARAAIFFHSLGGLTHYQGGQFNRKRNIVVSLAGPAAGFLLAALCLFLANFIDLSSNSIFAGMIQVGVFINIFWTVLNLMPVLPLDGGQVLRDALGPQRAKLTCTIGAIGGAVVALLALMYEWIFAAVFFGFLAYQNWKGAANLQGGTVRQ